MQKDAVTWGDATPFSAKSGPGHNETGWPHKPGVTTIDPMGQEFKAMMSMTGTPSMTTVVRSMYTGNGAFEN